MDSLNEINMIMLTDIYSYFVELNWIKYFHKYTEHNILNEA